MGYHSIIQVSKQAFAFASAISTSYVASTPLKTEAFNQGLIYITVTLGGATSVEAKVEWSPDASGTVWAQETKGTNTAGSVAQDPREDTYDDSGTWLLPLPVGGKRVRLSLKGTGAAPGAATASFVGAVI